MSVITLLEEKERRKRREKGGEKGTKRGKEGKRKISKLGFLCPGSFKKPCSEVHLAVELLAYSSCWISPLIPNSFLKHRTSTASASSSCSVMLILPFIPGNKVRYNIRCGLNLPFQWYKLGSAYLQFFLGYLDFFSMKWLSMFYPHFFIGCLSFLLN